MDRPRSTESYLIIAGEEGYAIWFRCNAVRRLRISFPAPIYCACRIIAGKKGQSQRFPRSGRIIYLTWNSISISLQARLEQSSFAGLIVRVHGQMVSSGMKSASADVSDLCRDRTQGLFGVPRPGTAFIAAKDTKNNPCSMKCFYDYSQVNKSSIFIFHSIFTGFKDSTVGNSVLHELF